MHGSPFSPANDLMLAVKSHRVPRVTETQVRNPDGEFKQAPLIRYFFSNQVTGCRTWAEIFYIDGLSIHGAPVQGPFLWLTPCILKLSKTPYKIVANLQFFPSPTDLPSFSEILNRVILPWKQLILLSNHALIAKSAWPVIINSYPMIFRFITN